MRETVRTPCEQMPDEPCENRGSTDPWNQGNNRLSPCVFEPSTLWSGFCCNITSETRIEYGSVVSRHGKGRLFWLYQAKSASFTLLSLRLVLTGTWPALLGRALERAHELGDRRSIIALLRPCVGDAPVGRDHEVAAELQRIRARTA